MPFGRINFKADNLAAWFRKITGDITFSFSPKVTSNVAKIKGTTVSGTTGSVNVVFSTSPVLTTPALGTPSSGTLTNCTFPTLNQNTTGSAASLSVSGQTGLMTVSGLVSTNRNKVVRDAADTILELGGSYTPTGTWTSMTMVTPALGTPASGVLSSCTSTTKAAGSNDTNLATDAYTDKEAGFIKNTVTVTSNAGSTSVSFRNNDFTNSSAATMTITCTTASAIDGQPLIVRIYDASAATQTITWVNTENSGVTAPTTSNGSTTLPLTVGFMYNSATSKWRCVGSV